MVVCYCCRACKDSEVLARALAAKGEELQRALDVRAAVQCFEVSGLRLQSPFARRFVGSGGMTVCKLATFCCAGSGVGCSYAQNMPGLLAWFDWFP